jgi:hypothetical protein
MDIIERVQKEYPSKFVPYGFQKEIILKAIKVPASLLKMDVGTGKTIVSWFMALGAAIESDISQILILCPPTLIRQWYEFVTSFQNIPSVCAYRGTLAQRERMDLTEAVIIMGYQIFLNDFEKIFLNMFNRKVYVICDEVSLRDTKTKTYRKLRLLLYNVATVKDLNALETPDPVKPFTLLNATPISNPAQTYGYIKMLTPHQIPNLNHFETLYVARKDRYKKAVAFQNLDLLEEGFKMRRFDANADELLDLPPITYIPITYDLEPEHFDAYAKMVNKELAEIPEKFLKNSRELDNLFIRLQQMVTNPDMFEYPYVPAYLEVLDQRLEELGDEKVIIYSHFKVTNQKTLKHLKTTAVGYWSEFSPKEKEASEDAFRGRINRLVAHVKSGGVGLNLQFARHQIFVEVPTDPATFKQAVGRIHRNGQQRKQFVAILLASGTIQERIYYNLIVKDQLLSQVIGDKKSLRDFLL